MRCVRTRGAAPATVLARPARRFATAAPAPAAQRRVFAFGNSVDGQLGLGRDVKVSEKPRQVPALDGTDFVALASGDMHCIGATRSGDLLSWGNSGHRDFVWVPTKIARSPAKMHLLVDVFIQLRCLVYSCGSGQQGALGHGGIESERYLRQVTTLERQKIVQVGCGWTHSFAINDKGVLFSWGGSSYGQLGHGEMMTRKLPTPIAGLMDKNVTQVAGGLYHSIAVVDNKDIYSWGRNASEQLGLPEAVAFEPRKVDFSLDSDETIRQLCTGLTHSLLITSKGRLFTWGTGQKGELGLGQGRPKAPMPTLVPLQHRLVFASLWSTHNVAITDEGRLLVWGSNTDHQLGLGERKLIFEPRLLDSMSAEFALHVATGFAHTVVLTRPRDA